jgi:luciferase family oxidoreductase group 1
MTPLSVLDLAPIVQGSHAGEALANSLELARHVERLGYQRFWLAEHHNMPGIASAATAVVIGHIAGGTKTIRVGAGGVMLPNHAPLIIAEQFGTLATLYPDRIDLGVGRAPGTDQITAMALRRNLDAGVDSFPQDVVELIRYFQHPVPGQKVRAIPGMGLDIPVWILGSSLYGAQLAAMLGLPFAFASHFAPQELDRALNVYRTGFKGSAYLDRPFAMVAANLVAAETDEQARRLFTSLQQAFVNLRTGNPGPMPPPSDDFAQRLDPGAKAMLDHALAYSAVGSPDTVKARLKGIIDQTGADELILTGPIYDHAARLNSFRIAAEVMEIGKDLVGDSIDY